MALDAPCFTGVFARRGQMAEREGFPSPLALDIMLGEFMPSRYAVWVQAKLATSSKNRLTWVASRAVRRLQANGKMLAAEQLGKRARFSTAPVIDRLAAKDVECHFRATPVQQQCVAELCSSSPARPVSSAISGEAERLAGAGGIKSPRKLPDPRASAIDIAQPALRGPSAVAHLSCVYRPSMPRPSAIHHARPFAWPAAISWRDARSSCSSAVGRSWPAVR